MVLMVIVSEDGLADSHWLWSKMPMMMVALMLMIKVVVVLLVTWWWLYGLFLCRERSLQVFICLCLPHRLWSFHTASGERGKTNVQHFWTLRLWSVFGCLHRELVLWADVLKWNTWQNRWWVESSKHLRLNIWFFAEVWACLVGRELNWQYLTKDERYKSSTLKVSMKTCFVLYAAEFFVFISLRCFQENQVEPVLWADE